jgi:hypothetical protein
MSTRRLTAIAIVAGFLYLSLATHDLCADSRQERAVERLKTFGGFVHAYSPPVHKTFLPTATGPLSATDPKSVIFFNTSLRDIDLAVLADSLIEIGNLQRLVLSYTRVTGTLPPAVAAIGSLEEIDLSSTPISGEGLVGLTLPTNLKRVSLNDTTLPRDAFDVFTRDIAPRLTTLQLSGARVVDPQMQPVDSKTIALFIGRCTLLEHLDLSGALASRGSKEEKNGVADLSNLTGLVQLTELNLASDNLRNSALSSVVQLTQLTALNLSGSARLNDNDLSSVWPAASPLLGLHNLQRLNLSGTHLTDAQVPELAAQLQDLTDLNISDTYTLVDDKAAASLDQLTNLTRLSIANTGVNDRSFRAIWKGDCLRKLGSLDISGTMVTDRGLTTPNPLDVGFKELRELFAADTKITTGGVKRRNAILASLNPPPGAGLKLLNMRLPP